MKDRKKKKLAALLEILVMKVFKQVYVPCRASGEIETLKRRSVAIVATTCKCEIIINNGVDVDITFLTCWTLSVWCM